MKAAVLHERGQVPRYEEFPDPVAREGEVIVEVKAVAVENVDRMVASGSHYASAQLMPQLPAIPCFDGVGALPDGTLVGFGLPRPPYGALAEKTVVPETNVMPAPEGLDPAVAVVLGSAITGMSLRTAAGLQAGETVLIQGATGVAGRLAVQVARLLGAGRIVATGRSDEALRQLGADAVINTSVDDASLQQRYSAESYDVVLDFLWGRPTEILLRSLVPTGFGMGKPTRIVQIGESAGGTLSLSAESLRTSGVEIYGAAKGLDGAGMKDAYEQVLAWAREGSLTFEIERVPLSGIETAWTRTDLRGKRLVVVM